MRNRIIQVCAGIALAVAAVEPSCAATLYNGWNYVIDSQTDGTQRTGPGSPAPFQVGGSDNPFEMYGMAIRDDGDRVSVAFTGNMPLGGVNDPWGTVPDGNTAWGDLFFNFTGEDFATASARGDLAAIRFAGNNGAGVNQLGVYTNVTARSVSVQNDGWSSVSRYSNGVQSRGGNPSMGDLAMNDSYFGDQTLNVINSGQRIGDIDFLSGLELSNLGLDFNNFNASGRETFGFSFEKPDGFIGSYIAHIIAECFNDGIAARGLMTLPPVPPPPPEPEPPSIPFECEPTNGQLNPVLPTYVDAEGWRVFENVPGGLWYDPDAHMGFEFQARGGTSFTEIEDFPCGISANDEFEVFVGAKRYGNKTYRPGESLTFPYPVQYFTIQFPYNHPRRGEYPNPFAIKLDFPAERGTFSYRLIPPVPEPPDVPEPSLKWGLLLLGVLVIIARKR